MEELESILQNICVTKFDIHTSHWVHITHIITPHDFYVRPTQYRTFIQKVETSQPSSKPSSLTEYDIIIFDMNRSGNALYARGRVCYKNVTENSVKYDIFAIDYGYLHKAVSEEYIWDCNEDFLKIPPLAVYCQLGHCASLQSENWSDEAIDAFKFFVANERAKMIIVDKTFDKLIVELRNSNPDDIATLMAYSGYSTLGYIHNAISRVPTVVPKKMFYTFKNVKENETLHVRVQSGKSHEAFYVMEVDDYQQYLNDRDNITYYAKKEHELTENLFKINTPVCVKDDLNKYHRAIIIKITSSDTKAIVKLVDTGKEEETHILNMRPVPERCLKIPVSIIYCSTSEEQITDFGFNKFLYPGIEYLIQIKKLGKEFESPNIVNIFPLQGNSTKKYRR